MSTSANIKKTTKAMLAALAVMTFTSCEKTDITGDENLKEVKISATSGTMSRMGFEEIDNTMKLTWEAGDVIYVGIPNETSETFVDTNLEATGFHKFTASEISEDGKRATFTAQLSEDALSSLNGQRVMLVHGQNTLLSTTTPKKVKFDFDKIRVLFGNDNQIDMSYMTNGNFLTAFIDNFSTKEINNVQFTTQSALLKVPLDITAVKSQYGSHKISRFIITVQGDSGTYQFCRYKEIDLNGDMFTKFDPEAILEFPSEKAISDMPDKFTVYMFVGSNKISGKELKFTLTSRSTDPAGGVIAEGEHTLTAGSEFEDGKFYWMPGDIVMKPVNTAVQE